MQLQNHLLNFSEESKKNNIDNDNTINSINFQNSPNEKELNKNSIKMKELEHINNKNKFELNNIKNININENVENIHFSKNTPLDTDKSPFNFLDSESKSDEVKNYDHNHLVFNPIDKSDINDLDHENDIGNDKNFFNYFFHNNNNKINNHNNNDKEKEKTANEEENYNSINENIFNIQEDSHSTLSPHINPTKSNEYIYDKRNFKGHDFPSENSNSNFRKKTKNKRHFKVRFGDWICPKCENLNFSFRKKCNRCGLSKEETELNNNNCEIQQQQQHENNLDYQRPIMLNNININYILNSNYQVNNINIVYNPVYYNISNINNYYGNYNNFNIFYPCNVNIK